MKRIAVFVCFAYAAIFIALTWPSLMIAFFPVSMAKCVAVYSNWPPYWILLAVLVFCQAGLLLIPLRITSRRPIARKHIFLPVIVSGLLIGALSLGVICSLYEFVAKGLFSEKWETWAALAACAVIWAIWSVVFCRVTRNEEPKSVIQKQCRRLLQGSVITLLVAVPTHIVARCRGYCCAGFFTFIGIAFGIAVMLACFGPAVYFLYADRWRKLHPKQACGDKKA